MPKFVKWSLWSLVGIFFLLAIVVIGVTQFLDPNNFKSQITNLVEQQTGQKIEIDGNIEWSWFPNLGLKMSDLRLLEQENQDNNLLLIQKARTSIALMPLLSKSLVIKDLELNNLNYRHSLTITADVDTLKLSGISLAKNSLNINNVDLTNIKLFEGKDTKKPKVLMSIQAKNINFKDKVASSKINIKAKIAQQTVDFNANISTDLNKQIITIDPIVTNFAKSKLTGKTVITNLKSGPVINFNLLLDKATISGKANIDISKDKPKTTFDIVLNGLDIKNIEKLTNSLNQDLPKTSSNSTKKNKTKAVLATNKQPKNQPIKQSKNKPLHKNKSLKQSPKEDILIPIELIKKLNLKGKLKATNTKHNDLLIDLVDANIKCQDSILTINPLKINFLGSKHVVDFSVNAKQTPPKITIVENARNFEINNILNHLKKPNKLEGNTNIHAQISSQGNTKAQLEQNLTGYFEVSISNGKLYGADLEKILKQVETTLVGLFDNIKHTNKETIKRFISSEITQWKQPIVSESQTTPFRELIGVFEIKNNTVNNTDFSLRHPHYFVQGYGVYNLDTQAIDYTVAASLTNYDGKTDKEIINFMRANPLPIHIKGTLEKPKIHPELDEFSSRAIKFFQKSAIKQLGGKALDKVFKKIKPKDGDSIIKSLEGIFGN